MRVERGQRSSQLHLPVCATVATLEHSQQGSSQDSAATRRRRQRRPLTAITVFCQHGEHSRCQDIGQPHPICCCPCHPWKVDLNYLRWVKSHRLSDDQLQQLVDRIRAEFDLETSPLRPRRRAA